MRVDLLLRQILTATAEKTAAERRIARYRDRLDTEARARFAAEGAAPTWKAPKLGNVRLDPKDAKPYVDDPVAFASYVAERHPDETTATITVPTAQLDDALEALTFAGVADVAATVTVREPFGGKLLAELQIREELEDEPDIPLELRRVLRTPLRLLDEETGEAEEVPGVKVTDPSATLVVTLDPDAKRRVIAEADAVVDTEEADERVVEEAYEATPGGPDLLATQEAAVTVDLSGPGTVADALVEAFEAPLIDPAYPAAGRVRPPAPALSDAERAIVDAFEAAPDALEVDAAEARLEAAIRHTGEEPDPALVTAAATATEVARRLDETYRTDDLKRIARRRRLPVSGTKVALAERLALAGVTLAEALTIVDRAEA